jgi:hypothetical protein
VDATRYFGDDETVPTALKAVSSKNNLGYIPVYQTLLEANRAGISTKWPHDAHFNEAGNEILSRSLFAWTHSMSSPFGRPLECAVQANC